MVVIVVALEDCTISVTTPPQKAPDSGVAAALPRTVRRLDPASPLRPAVMTLMPSRNRPTPPRTEIVVDMRVPPGTHCDCVPIRSQSRGSSAENSQAPERVSDHDQ